MHQMNRAHYDNAEKGINESKWLHSARDVIDGFQL